MSGNDPLHDTDGAAPTRPPMDPRKVARRSSVPPPPSSRGGVRPDIPSYTLFIWRIVKTAFDSSWRFYVWMTGLTALALLGANAWAGQVASGMGVTHLSDHVSWGFYIANFTFGVGLAAGAVMMVIPAYLYDDHDMHDVVIIGEILAIAAIVVSLSFVVVDMGRPDRMWHLLPGIGRFNWPRSMLTWDVIVLNGYLLLNLHITGYLLYMRFLGRRPAKRWYVPFVLLSIGWAVSVHAVTAFLYAGLGGRPFWNTALLAPRFIVTAFVSGPAFVVMLLLLIRRFSTFHVGAGPIRTLHQVLKVTILVNLFMFGSEVFTSFYTGGAHATAMRYLLVGSHGAEALVPWIWAAIGLNLTSLALVHHPAAGRDLRWLAVGCGAAFGGIWIEKGMGLIVPAFVPSTLHELVEYLPSSTEWRVGVGIWAFGAMILTVALKIALRVLTGRVGVHTYAPSSRRPPRAMGDAVKAGAEQRRHVLAVLGLLGLPIACGDDGGSTVNGGSTDVERPGQADGWDDDLRMATPVDLDPDPHVLEIELVARVADLSILPGTTTPAWTYDGALPGPLLELTAGDRLVVHFRNELPDATTIHWHGLRIPAEMDGAPHDGKPAVSPGGSFDYDFVVPDAGLYWYHPHVDSAMQLGSGLYGAIHVRPGPDSPAEPDGLGDEVVLVLSDIGVHEDGSLRDPDAGGDLGMLFGREGDQVLVNGRRLPGLGARSGLRQRWRVVNTAKSRYFELELPGHRFTRIGGDGGLLPAPRHEERLLLTPGQRVDVVVTLEGAPGSELPLRWVAHDRGYGTADFRDPITILTVRFEDAPPGVPGPLPQVSRSVDAPDPSGAWAVDIALTQTTTDDGVVLGIDGVPSWDSEPIRATVGERQLWTISNEMDWDHPFHLHGFFFHEVDDEGDLVEPRELRDTLNIPSRETRRFVVQYENRPGMWMFHCHILDHADAGMMGMVHLEP